MADLSHTERLAAIASIQDSLRRSLYNLVSRNQAPMSRDDAATALGMSRSTAAFHLDRLVESGLLTAHFARTSGRSGPGAGRPAKLYEKASAEISVTIPERHYDLMGDLLAEAIEAAERTSEPARSSLSRVAHERGAELGARHQTIDELLMRVGYEPRPTPDGGVELANCPFHSLVSRHTELVCEANVALLSGAALAVNEAKRTVEFSPEAGHCCVRLQPIAH